MLRDDEASSELYAWAREIPRSRAASSTVVVTRVGLTLPASDRRL